MHVAGVVLALMAAGLVCGLLLPRAGWARRHPVTAIASWQVVQAAVLLGMLWIPLLVLAPDRSPETTFREFVIGCLHGLLEVVSRPGQDVAASVAVVVLLVTVGRLLAVLVTTFGHQRRERGAARAAVTLVGSDGPLGVRVVPGRSIGAYCVPGRRPLVVLTAAAEDELSGEELAAVLAHERAHLRWRHHLVLSGSQALATAFPFVPAFVDAERECRLLVEMAADDQAARVVGPRPVATALLRTAISSASPPPVALGLARGAVQERVERLDDDGASNRPRARVACIPLLAAVVAGVLAVTHSLTEWFTALASCQLLGT